MIDLHLKAGYKFELNRNHLIKKNGNEVIILDDLSFSARKEMDALAQHFYKELDIKKITSSEIIDKQYNSFCKTYNTFDSNRTQCSIIGN